MFIWNTCKKEVT